MGFFKLWISKERKLGGQTQPGVGLGPKVRVNRLKTGGLNNEKVGYSVVPILVDLDSDEQIIDFITAQIGSRRWKKIVLMVAIATFWTLWIVRNDVEFNGKSMPILKVVKQSKEDSFIWFKNRAGDKSIRLQPAHDVCL